MPLTEEQAFKVGFLKKCAEDGLSLAETKQRVKLALHMTKSIAEKRAFWPYIAGAGGYLGGKAMEVGGKALGMVPGLLSTAGIAGVALPVAAGAGAGYLTAKATNPDRSIVDDAKQDEIIGEYQRLAEEARRRARLRRLQMETGQRVIALTPER